MDDVACYGYESRLTSCIYNSSTYDCGHDEDAGVHCQGRDIGYQNIPRRKIRQSEYIHPDLHVLLHQVHLTVLNILSPRKNFITSYSSSIFIAMLYSHAAAQHLVLGLM